MNRWEVIDSHTLARIGRVYKSITRAARAADVLDLEYGAVRFIVCPVRA